MSKITLYLNDIARALLEQAARECGMSKSRWVREAIRKNAIPQWPDDCIELAGKFIDFPLRDSENLADLRKEVASQL